jgi:tetratricopeptide (TPR) repeat protein
MMSIDKDVKIKNIDGLLYEGKLYEDYNKLINNKKILESYFQFMHENCEERKKYLYRSNDIEDPKTFLKIICNDENFLSKIKNCTSIYNLCISQVVDTCIVIPDLESIPIDDLKEKLVDCLNNLINQKAIFDEQALANMELNEEIKKRIRECKHKDSCTRINRFLLEQKYPQLKRLPRISSPNGLKHFTKAQEGYNQYMVTKQIECLDSARVNCDAALTIEKNNKIFLGLLHNIACAYFSEERHNEAEKAFKQAASLSQNAASSFSGWGFCLRELLRFREAMKAAERAIYLDRWLASPWYLLGAIYLDLGCYASDLYDKSIAYFYEAIKREEKYPYPWLYLGIIFYRKAALQKQLDEKSEKWKIYNKIALCCIEKSVDLAKYDYPEFPSVKLQKAACLIQRGEKGDIRDAEKLLLDTLIENLYNRACAESLSKRTDLALKYIKEAFKQKKATRVGVLFDPDFDQTRTTENEKLKNIFSDFPDSEETLKEIREILSDEKDCYILASFEAVCGDTNKAIDLFGKESIDDKLRFEKDKERLLADRHFESLPEISIRINTKEENKTFAPGSNIEFIINLIKTRGGRMNGRITYNVPDGLDINHNKSDKNLAIIYKDSFYRSTNGHDILLEKKGWDISKPFILEAEISYERIRRNIQNIVKVEAITQDGRFLRDLAQIYITVEP